MGYAVREIQATPNPNAMKFVLDRSITQQPASFFNAESAQGDAIASRLFDVPGVSSLLFLGDFVTVNKTAGARWDGITRQVREILQEVQASGRLDKK